MSHSHQHHLEYGKLFAIGILLNIGYVVLELIYGIWINSSALLADAGHNASDVLSLIFAWTAMWLATKKPKDKYTFGLRKATILVSLINSLLLFAAVIAIGWDAMQKIQKPIPIPGAKMMIVAGVGVLVNAFTALLFFRGQKTDLNIRGAFLHMAADAGVSLSVVLAGLVINLTDKYWIDPLMSFIVIVVIVYGIWSLFSESLNLALDAAPQNIDVEKIRQYLLSKADNVHDLHIWAMSTTEIALTAHLIVAKDFTIDKSADLFLQSLQQDLEDMFHIEHTTLQIEKQPLAHCTHC